MTGPESEPVRLVAFGRSDVGRRRANNQDRMLVQLVGTPGAYATGGEEGVFGPSEIRSEAPVVALVADGVGGRAGGARASELTADRVRRCFSAPGGSPAAEDLVPALVGALREANQDVFAEGTTDSDLAGMGTTATLAAVADGHVYVAQVGDSRAYLIRGDRAARLTRDQSLVQDMIDSGILDESDTESVTDNVLLQAIGVQASVRPAATFHPVVPGDRVLLCSDGLSQVVTDSEMAVISRDAPAPDDFVHRLVDLANERGGPDNTTVVVLDVVESSGPAGESGDELRPRRWRRRPA